MFIILKIFTNIIFTFRCWLTETSRRLLLNFVYLLSVILHSFMGIILFGLKSVLKKNPLWGPRLILLWRHEERKRERSPTRDNTLYQFPLSYVFSHQGYDRSRPPSTFDESFSSERNRYKHWNNFPDFIQSMISARSLQTCTEVI